MGDDTIEALLAEFPATELDRPASEAFVRAEIAGLRTELKDELAGHRAEFSNGLASLEISISERFRQMTMWFTGALIASVTASAAVATAIARLAG